MSRSSYTASERRGIILIAAISLLLIGGGLIFSFKEHKNEPGNAIPMVEEYTELLPDSLNDVRNNKSSKKSRKGLRSISIEKMDSTIKKVKRNKKVIRQRSPLDEVI